MSEPATTLPVDFRLEEGLPSGGSSVTHAVVPGGSVAVTLTGLQLTLPNGARSTQVQIAYQSVRLGDGPAFDTRVHAFRLG